MKTDEFITLDAWIAEHVFGWKPDVANVGHNHQKVRGWWKWQEGDKRFTTYLPHFSTSSGDAMHVLKKCGERTAHIHISTFVNKWIVGSHALGNPARESTLELAICMFAKQLFSQTKETK